MRHPTEDQIARARRAVIVDGSGHGGIAHYLRMRMHWRILSLAREKTEAATGALIRVPRAVFEAHARPSRHLRPLRPFGGDAA